MIQVCMELYLILCKICHFHISPPRRFFLYANNGYMFCIYDLKTGKLIFYSHWKGVVNKGPKKVCTFVLDYIKNYIGNNAKKLHLFLDGCAGQNRNHAFVSMMLFCLFVMQTFSIT